MLIYDVINLDIWRYKLGHLLQSGWDIPSGVLKTKNCKLCFICHLAKMHRLLCCGSDYRANEFFDLIHCDI